MLAYGYTDGAIERLETDHPHMGIWYRAKMNFTSLEEWDISKSMTELGSKMKK